MGQNWANKVTSLGRANWTKSAPPTLRKRREKKQHSKSRYNNCRKRRRRRLGNCKLGMTTRWKVVKISWQSGGRLTLCAASTGQRPPNTYEKWLLQQRNAAQSKLTLDSPEIAGMSLVRTTPSIQCDLLINSHGTSLAASCHHFSS